MRDKFMNYARLECKWSGEWFDFPLWIREWNRLSSNDKRFYSSLAAWNFWR